MIDPLRPVAPKDPTVPPVDLRILPPLEREKQRRERDRKRRQKAVQTPEKLARPGHSGLDVRV
jgi:hypothetical protein